ncbi:MAG TPA: HutD family protein [Rudaea sp.]|nr:HutD family protein [Rudaea sp.]
MRARVLRRGDYRRMRWKNGGGWTTELAVHPAGAEDGFDWRISVADIESDGAFSTFSGCERHIALLEGAGMELRFDTAPAATLERRLEFVRFAGEWQTFGALRAGPVRDFNVIARRDAVRTDVWHRPLVGPMVFPADAEATWFVYLAAGTASLKLSELQPLEAGDSLLIAPGAENVVLTGGGEVAIVKFTKRE